MERTGARPDLALPEVALWHHSPCPGQGEHPPTRCHWGPAPESGCSRWGRVSKWQPTVGVCKRCQGALSHQCVCVLAGFRGWLAYAHMSHRRGIQTGQPPCPRGWWVTGNPHVLGEVSCEHNFVYVCVCVHVHVI